MTNAKPITAVLIGAGFRGREVYGSYALKNPEKLKFIAVADPDEARRRLFQKAHGIPDHQAFTSWEELFTPNQGKLADAAFICTQDNLHFQPAMAAMNLSYNLVLEKPISPSLKECREIAQVALEKKLIVQICHVLRFTKFWRKVKELVQSGSIGDIVHYDHSENVSYWHFGHSYVRGHYKNKAHSSPLILAKSCHDLDLMYWVLGQRPLTVQSTGELTFYRPENAPPRSPDRCTQGCPEEARCPWNAPRLYLTGEPLLRIGLHAPDRLTRWGAASVINNRNLMRLLSKVYRPLEGYLNWNQFPTTVITSDLTPEGKLKALQEGPFGKCIFKCGNDVMDHQITTYTFPRGVTGTLTLHGVSDLEGRELRIFGTKGSIRGYFRYNAEKITVTDFRYSKCKVVHRGGLTLGGHGGGDYGLLDSFVRVMKNEISPHDAGADAENALEAHYMAFAAEDARVSHKKLELENYRLEQL